MSKELPSQTVVLLYEVELGDEELDNVSQTLYSTRIEILLPCSKYQLLTSSTLL